MDLFREDFGNLQIRLINAVQCINRVNRKTTNIQ